MPKRYLKNWVAVTTNGNDGPGEHWYVKTKDNKMVVCTIPGGLSDANQFIAKLIEKAPDMFVELSRVVAVAGDLPEFEKTKALFDSIKSHITDKV